VHALKVCLELLHLLKHTDTLWAGITALALNVARGVDKGATETRSLQDLGHDELIHRGSELGEALEALCLAVSLDERVEPL